MPTESNDFQDLEWVPKAWLVSWFKQEIHFPVTKVEPAAVLSFDGECGSKDVNQTCNTLT
jgi:hypothetical protein